jgi:hypothetical protein
MSFKTNEMGLLDKKILQNIFFGRYTINNLNCYLKNIVSFPPKPTYSI